MVKIKTTTRQPKTPEEWFEKRFQVFATDTAGTIPKGDKAE